MAEYIDREAVFKAYEEVQRRNGPWRFETLIESVPAADVSPVVHAHYKGPFCSNCGRPMATDCWGGGMERNKYCYYCGAKMDDPKGD